MTDKPKQRGERAANDPLGYDTRRPFHKVAHEMAEDALAGRHKDAVDAELETVRGRWGNLSKLTDRTDELRGTHPEFLLDNSLIALRRKQLTTLRLFREEVREIGPELNFVIERCVDENPGYNFCWDNDGSREQDDRLEELIAKLCVDIGFQR